MKYNTEQKILILDVLRNNHKELTVKDIFNVLEQKVSLTTIYRLINELVNENKIIKINNDKNATFIFIEEDDVKYYHMRCDLCGDTVHIEKEDIVINNNFNIDLIKTILVGKCSDCSVLNGGK